MPKAIIHVHQQKIRRNAKLPTGAEHEPPIIVRSKGSPSYANTVSVKGPCRIIYSPDKPLSCGARVWIEVDDATNVEIS